MEAYADDPAPGREFCGSVQRRNRLGVRQLVGTTGSAPAISDSHVRPLIADYGPIVVPIPEVHANDGLR